MTDEQEWMDGFKGPQFDNVTTEFHFHKLAREIDQVNDIETLKHMLKQYISIHLKEKEMWKKLTNSMLTPINNPE